MLLYSDVLTGDEMFSDAFPLFVLRRSVRCYFPVNVTL
jgi:Translationally controlled tumour protein